MNKLKLLLLLLIFGTISSTTKSQVQFLKETFGGETGFYDGASKDYNGFTSDLIFSTDTFRIQHFNASTGYTEASGGLHAVMSKRNEIFRDTLTFKYDLSATSYSNIRFGAGIFSYANAANRVSAEFSTDSLSWTKFDNANLHSGAFGANGQWGFVVFNEILPNTGMIHIRLITTSEPTHYDDFVLMGDPIVAPDTDATLSDLTLSEGTLDPVFNAATYDYTAELPSGTTATPTVTATPADASATVDVTDATDVTSGDETDRTTTIVVTAEDGETQLTYSVVFNVAPITGPGQVQFLKETFGESGFYDGASQDYGGFTSDLIFSTDTFRLQGWNASTGYAEASGGLHAILSEVNGFMRDTLTFKYDLSTTGYSNIRFGAGIFDYANASTRVTVEFSTDSLSWTEFDNTNLHSGEFGGNGVWGFVVFNEILPNTGMIHIRLITRSSQTHFDDFILMGDPINTDATLSNLIISEGTLDSAFDSATYDYTAELPSGTTVAPTITATPTVANATVDITDAVDVTSGDEADRTTTVTVTAENGITQLTYSIVFNVAPNTDATLSDLTLSEGTLDPAFDAATSDYTAELQPGTTATPTVTATPTDANATVDVTDAVDVTSGDEADRTTTVIVTAEDGTTQLTYSVVFNVAPNTDATLSDLTLSEGTLDPVFDAATYAYTAELPSGTTATPTVTATPTDANATVVVTDAADVTSEVEADRTTTIVVTAEDGATQLTYSVVFDVLTSVYDLYLDNLNIYPNPVSDELKIENISGFTRIELTNLAGQHVRIMETHDAERITLNISNLKNGVYLLNFYIKDARVGTRQVIKQ